MTRFHANDREQWQADIAHFSEHAMQCGLIDHRAGEKRLAVVESREGQTLKPVCPLAAQMALDSDLIDPGLIWITFRVECAWHDSVPPDCVTAYLCGVTAPQSLYHWL